MTATNLDEDIFVLLDFEPEHACESIREPCSNKAVWAGRAPCCGDIWMVCAEHKEKTDKRLAEGISLGLCIRCNECGTDHYNMPWEWTYIG